MGGYMSPEQAEASSPYGGGSGTPATLAEADAGNVVGRKNREDVGLGSGYGGYSGEQLNTVDQQRAQREQQQRNQQEQDRLNYEQRARVNAGLRPGYYDESTIGDPTTQNFLKTRRMMSAVGMPVPDEDVYLGSVLEFQRKTAVSTPGTRDDQFFTNELSKWNRNPIELSSAYHDVGMVKGVPIPANPFENRGDVALAFEKGGNVKDFTVDRYGFNPNVGTMINTLPGGKGLQETALTVAKTGQPANVDFQPAIEYQVSQKGRYGVYGSLYGGIPDTVEVSAPTGREPATTTFNGLTVVGASVPGKGFGTVNKDWNPFVASAAEPIGYIAEGIQIPNTTPLQEQKGISDTFLDNLQNSMRTTFALTPGMFGFAIASDTLFATIRKDPSALPFADMFIPEKKTDTITPEQYKSNLATYNTKLSSYNQNLTAYNQEKTGIESGALLYATDLGTYNEKVNRYNLNPTQEGYDLLSTEKLSLDKRYTGILNQQSGLGFASIVSEHEGLTAQQKTLEDEQKRVAPAPTILDRIGGVYEKLSVGLAPYTTDPIGIGAALKKTPDIDLQKYGGETVPPIYSDVINTAKGTYIGVSQHPLDIALTFAGGEAISGLEGLTKIGIAKAAMSKFPVASTVGRAMSTPLFADISMVGKGIVGVAIVGYSAKHIIDQPTPIERGEALGRTAIQFAGFGVGMSNYKMAEPVNDFAGKGFFSGKPEFGPLEKAQFKIETSLRSRNAENPEAYREVAAITLPPRVVEPLVKEEPDFSILSKSGKYATEIRETIIEQPHSVIGSSSVIQQYPPDIAEASGLRVGKDVDALIESPTKAWESLASKTGLSKTDVGSVLDAHPIPPNYPGLKPSVEPDVNAPDSSLLTRLFGDPYRSIGFPRSTSEVIVPGAEYNGKLTYEAAQVQFGRKAAGVALVMEDPIKYGYRGDKDIYDFVTEYFAQRRVAFFNNVPDTAFKDSDVAMQSFVNREFTFGTVKGQRTAEEAPVITRSVKDIVSTIWADNQQKWDMVGRGEEIPGDLELSFSMGGPEQGIIPSVLRSASPSIWSSSLSTVPSKPSSQSPSQQKSSALPSIIGISPAPSSISPPAPATTLFMPPSSPRTPGSPNIITGIPPYIPPPRSPPSPAPTIPPYTPPPYKPPSSPPPYSPPSLPPYVPPSTPPNFPIPPGLPLFPGSESRGKKRKPRKFKELFPFGLDISTMSFKGIKTPRMARPKKGRVIPKSMLSPVKRKKK